MLEKLNSAIKEQMMKKFLLTVLSVLITSLVGHAADNIIRLGADEWAPYNITPNTHCKNESKLLCEGYMVDIARAVFEKKGYSVEYYVMPWKRAIEETKRGRFAGLIGADKEDGKGFIFPREEMSINKLAFYVGKDSQWHYQGPDSLKTVRLGVIDGYGYRKWLREYINENSGNPNRVQQISGNTPMETNIKKLVNNRIDVIVDSEATIRYVANNMGYLDKIKPAGYGTLAKNIYIVFSHADPNGQSYAEQLSAGIEEMRKSGELEKVLGRYGLNDWKQ